MSKSIIIAPSAEKTRTSRTKRVYFKRNKDAEMESIKFETMKIENNMGDVVIKAAFETEDLEIIKAFKAKKGFKVLSEAKILDGKETPKPNKEEAGSGEAVKSGSDDLDREALLAKYAEVFGSKAPKNIKTETLATKIAEKEAESKE